MEIDTKEDIFRIHKFLSATEISEINVRANYDSKTIQYKNSDGFWVNLFKIGDDPTITGYDFIKDTVPSDWVGTGTMRQDISTTKVTTFSKLKIIA